MGNQRAVRPDAHFDESIVVSPPFSCGVGFLMDILLRLEIRVRPPDRVAWTEGVNSFSPTPTLKEQYARHAARILEQDLFAFPDRKSVILEHRMDMARLPGRTHILFVRDPVDAVYSWHRRFAFAEKGVSFAQYLKNFSAFPHHLPHGMMVARPLDIYALFVLFWLLAAENPLIVRYEDIKSDPLGEMAQILAAIGAERSEAEIAEAVRLSSFDTLQSKMKSHANWSEANRRSQTYEWRERLTQDERIALTAEEPIASVCRLLSYEAPEGGDWGIIEHTSTCGIFFCESIRAVRAKFPAGEAVPSDYLAACRDLLATVNGRIRMTKANDVSFDAGDLDAVSSALVTIRLLNQIYDGAPPQPLERLERLVLGISAVLANCAGSHGLRHMAGNIGTFG